MKRIIVVVLCFLSSPCFAQVSDEATYLQGYVGAMARQAAHNTAMLDAEKLSHAQTKQELENLKIWVNNYFKIEK